MIDLLIRDVPDHVLAAVDARANQLGISRMEYVRRQLTRAATSTDEAVTAEHLRRFAETFPVLADAEVVAQAWQ